MTPIYFHYTPSYKRILRCTVYTPVAIAGKTGGNVPGQMTQPAAAVQRRQTTISNATPQETIREPFSSSNSFSVHINSITGVGRRGTSYSGGEHIAQIAHPVNDIQIRHTTNSITRPQCAIRDPCSITNSFSMHINSG